VDDSDRLFELLAAGEIDAAVEDSSLVLWRIGKDRRFRPVGDRLNKLGYRIGVRRTDPELYARIQAAVRDLAASKEIDEIGERWEGVAAPPVTAPARGRPLGAAGGHRPRPLRGLSSCRAPSRGESRRGFPSTPAPP